MDRKEYKLLVEGWRGYIVESLKSSESKDIEKISSELNEIVRGVREENAENESVVDDVGKRFRSVSIPVDVEREVRTAVLGYVSRYPGMGKLGAGLERSGWSVDGAGWVVKIASNGSGCMTNKSEIDYSKRSDGSGLQDMFVRVFEQDEVSDLPVWYICERVIVLNNIKDIGVMKKLLPTFWRVYSEIDFEVLNSLFWDKYEDGEKIISGVERDLKFFGRFVFSMLKKSVWRGREQLNRNVRVGRRIQGRRGWEEFDPKVYLKNVLVTVSGDNFFNNARELGYKGEEFELGEDWNKFLSVFRYIVSSDLHFNNLGMRYSSDPSPEDLVILDYDTAF